MAESMNEKSQIIYRISNYLVRKFNIFWQHKIRFYHLHIHPVVQFATLWTLPPREAPPLALAPSYTPDSGFYFLWNVQTAHLENFSKNRSEKIIVSTFLISTINIRWFSAVTGSSILKYFVEKISKSSRQKLLTVKVPRKHCWQQKHFRFEAMILDNKYTGFHLTLNQFHTFKIKHFLSV